MIYVMQSIQRNYEKNWVDTRISNFRAGMKDTIKWYTEHEEWWRAEKEAVESNYAKNVNNTN